MNSSIGFSKRATKIPTKIMTIDNNGKKVPGHVSRFSMNGDILLPMV